MWLTLTNIKNDMGAKIEPCGTPKPTLEKHEVIYGNTFSTIFWILHKIVFEPFLIFDIFRNRSGLY